MFGPALFRPKGSVFRPAGAHVSGDAQTVGSRPPLSSTGPSGRGVTTKTFIHPANPQRRTDCPDESLDSPAGGDSIAATAPRTGMTPERGMVQEARNA